MKSVSPYDAIEWLGLRLEVPQDWQIVRHGISSLNGCLTFTDRYSERMNLSWRKLDREPDVERIVAEQLQRDQTKIPDLTLARTTIPGWQAYRAESAESEWVRAARYEPLTSQLLEVWLSVRSNQKKSQLANERLVCAIAGTDPNRDTSRLQAFDTCLEYPRDLVLSTTKIEPANVTFEFERAAVKGQPFSRARAVVRRMGMASCWYRGNAVALIAREAKQVVYQTQSEHWLGAHRAMRVEGDTTKGPIQRWFGRSTRSRATLMHCEVENAVYLITTESYDQAPLLPERFKFVCCKPIGETDPLS